MYLKIYLLTVIFALLFQTVPAQQAVEEKENENAAALEKMAVEILRETSQMIFSLRSPQNRQTAVLRTADALWTVDEPTARNLFQTALADIKQSMIRIDGELNAAQNAAGNLAVNSSLQDLKRESMKIIAMRSALINTVAKHDLEMANAFLNETSRIVSNADFRNRLESTNKNLQSTVARHLAEKDVTTAVDYGRKKLADGVSSEVVGLMNRIYAKDPEKGAKFGGEIIEKLKEGGNNPQYYWLAIRLLTSGSSISERIISADSGKVPLLNESELADLSAYIADFSLNNKNRRTPNIPAPIFKIVEKHAPQKAAQVKRLSEQQRAASNKTGNAKAGVTIQPPSYKTEQQRIKARRDYEDELSTLLQRLRNENPTHGEKLEIIVTARSKISVIADKSYRLSKLISLAFFADKAGENESAQSLLSEAEALVSQQPKQRSDFNENKMLADAYAQINPEKSFAIAENMAYMLNGVIESYATYNEYLSNGNTVEDGEILIQNYGKQFTNFFIFSPATIKKLAETDAQRLKNLPDKFNRAELRIDARLNLASSLLRASNQKKGSAISPIIRVSEGF